MKKIFIGDSTLYLVGKRVAKKHPDLYSTVLPENISLFQSKQELELQIENIENATHPQIFMMIHDSKNYLEDNFFSLYTKVIAAGGAVFNKENELLMIFRRGKWDLPKGKVDPGESVREGAKREITEETGIGKLKNEFGVKFLNGKQECTYHTYFLNGTRVLKSTYWFRMRSKDKKELTPQEMEGIEKAEWCSKERVQENLKNSYLSIIDVVDEVMK